MFEDLVDFGLDEIADVGGDSFNMIDYAADTGWTEGLTEGMLDSSPNFLDSLGDTASNLFSGLSSTALGGVAKDALKNVFTTATQKYLNLDTAQQTAKAKESTAAKKSSNQTMLIIAAVAIVVLFFFLRR